MALFVFYRASDGARFIRALHLVRLALLNPRGYQASLVRDALLPALDADSRYGLQTVTVTRVFGLRVYTTYLTGSLAKFAEAVVHYAFWFYDRTRGHSRKRFWIAVRISAHQQYARHAVLTGGLWIAFFLGVICGALLKERYDLLSLLFPAAILLVATIVDLLRPVAAADEPRAWDDM